jgi:ureidoglycolate lyase
VREISVEPLTDAAFAPFGDVIALRDTPSLMINQGMCARHHDIARVDTEGAAGISLFHGQPYTLPLSLTMVERHPLGSQAFIPMHSVPFLVVVAPDEAGVPGQPRAFLTNGSQGVNYPKGQWHGVLTTLGSAQTFAVVDRCAEGTNLEEHWFEEAWVIVG